MRYCYLFLKRLFDMVCSLLGLIVSLPFWLVAVVGIKLSDPGPVFYVSNRLGRGNQNFRMYKFRSMRVGKANEALLRGEELRIFPFGQFMRDTKIDELPQLLNILKGDMSIVGPRPAATAQRDITRSGRFEAVGRVQAGLTGPSALYDYIFGDTVSTLEDYERLVLPTRLELDLVYLEKMSAAFDLKMIWWTVVCIACSIAGRKPDKIFAQLLQWAAEERKEPVHG